MKSLLPAMVLLSVILSAVSSKDCKEGLTYKYYSTSDCTGTAIETPVSKDEVESKYNTCTTSGTTYKMSSQWVCNTTALYFNTYSGVDCMDVNLAQSTEQFVWGQCTKGIGSYVIATGASMVKATTVGVLALATLYWA